MGRKTIQRDYKLYRTRIYQYFTENKKMPSFENLKSIFEVASKDTVHKIVNDLVNLGYIDRDNTGKIIPTQEEILNIYKDQVLEREKASNQTEEE
jgi:Mn-dependent DtxR family transcriptional regulator